MLADVAEAVYREFGLVIRWDKCSYTKVSPDSRTAHSCRRAVAFPAANGVRSGGNLREIVGSNFADGSLQRRLVGSCPHEGLESLPSAQEVLACERARRGEIADASFKRLSCCELVCGPQVLDARGAAISPIASATDVPKGARIVAPAKRRHCRVQPASRTMVRQCAANGWPP